MRYGKVILVLAAGILALSCSMTNGGANSTRVVTGTISVYDNSYWNFVKLGVFSGGTLGAYPKLGTSSTNASNVTTYRVSYHNLNDSSSQPIPPLSGTTYSISDTSGTSSAYSFELPATLPPYQTASDKEAYYYAAWYDGNPDNNLGLIDNLTVDTGEEFNRCAVKTGSDGVTATVVEYFFQSTDMSGNPSGNYKYWGYDGASKNEYIEIKDSSSGFNFTISATSGW